MSLGDAVGGSAWPMSPVITADRLMKFCPEADRVIVSQIAPALEQEAPINGVTSLLRRAHFLGQMAHESGRFRTLVESLNYSAQRIAVIWPRLAPRAQELAHNQEKLGNAAYANKNGNGDEGSQDGFKYRGRGLVQLTGRGNYRAVGLWVNLDLEGNPDLAASPVNAVLIAYSFWTHSNCNPLADRDDVTAVTRAINGGVNGLQDRIILTAKAKELFV